ncbi:restriction endonuclease [Actinokineospora sp. UTMC 2448]|uniref:restriction endonuclease n=1 Tax=Actinokineospora sp. UTMC 2448 TaxID=2268449 RepID=UPI002164112A|nr:restriction endonuclease [Actinokineospora sp. UTMC 2448]UVS81787.1 Restriction endonuclease [Actinokineospora sp. UTMC 2448]
MSDWQDYQEEVAAFFREIGMSAETDATIQGVRTSHDIDVAVFTEKAGFKVLWVVECKNWKRSVSKLHVLALREIVADLGADRGILMAENGFQSGAFEAATLTNVQLTSLRELRKSAIDELSMVELTRLQERIEECERRYWDLKKELRINAGLRPPVGMHGPYRGTVVISTVKYAIGEALLGRFPIRYDQTIPSQSLLMKPSEELDVHGSNPSELAASLVPVMEELESKLQEAETIAERPTSPDA